MLYDDKINCIGKYIHSALQVRGATLNNFVVGNFYQKSSNRSILNGRGKTFKPKLWSYHSNPLSLIALISKILNNNRGHLKSIFI